MSKQNPTRRIRARRGIYYRIGADGKRHYEFTYTDSDGRQRWQAVTGGIEDAEQARSERLGLIRKGARVAPSSTTFRDFANGWLEQQGSLRPRTLEAYRYALDGHLIPAFGNLKMEAVTADRIAQLIATMQRGGYSGWTIRGTLTPLSRILKNAARRGPIQSSPMGQLESGERPTIKRREIPEMGEQEVAALVAALEPRWRPLFSAYLYLGLRSSEARGLTWEHIDLSAGIVRVRQQIGRDKEIAPGLKTERARRDVYLKGEPAKMARILREHKAASYPSREHDLVFASATGTAIEESTLRRVLNRALKKANLPHLTIHDLRHLNASLRLVEWGEPVEYVSDQLGHADPSITYSVYAHLISRARHAAEARAAMEAEFGGKIVESSGGNRPQSSGGLQAV